MKPCQQNVLSKWSDVTCNVWWTCGGGLIRVHHGLSSVPLLNKCESVQNFLDDTFFVCGWVDKCLTSMEAGCESRAFSPIFPANINSPQLANDNRLAHFRYNLFTLI